MGATWVGKKFDEMTTDELEDRVMKRKQLIESYFKGIDTIVRAYGRIIRREELSSRVIAERELLNFGGFDFRLNSGGGYGNASHVIVKNAAITFLAFTIWEGEDSIDVQTFNEAVEWQTQLAEVLVNAETIAQKREDTNKRHQTAAQKAHDDQQHRKELLEKAIKLGLAPDPDRPF